MKTFKKVSWLIAIPFGFLLGTLLFNLGDRYVIVAFGLLCLGILSCIIILAYYAKKPFKSKVPCRECGTAMEYPFKKCSECGWIPKGKHKERQLKFKAEYERMNNKLKDNDA